MIARHEAQREQTTDVWATLAAPLPPGVTAWRQDGRPVARDGKFFARFVAYIDANTVRDRLDTVVPGEWNLTLELLPPMPGADEDTHALPDANRCAFKARLQILGVVREDVGTGKDYKQASTDAFKRVAVRFGVGRELYDMGQNWVRMDGDGRYAKPMEDPQAAYERRMARATATGGDAGGSAAANGGDLSEVAPLAGDEHADHQPPLRVARSRAPVASDVPPCPKCGGRMWDNRLGKRNPRAPDFKCRDRNCDGVVWPPKPGAKPAVSPADAAHAEAENGSDVAPAQLGGDEIPF